MSIVRPSEQFDSCSSNHFCASLPSSLRAKLCKLCIKCTFAQKTAITDSLDKVFLPLEGICCFEGGDSIFVVLERGDFIPFPSLNPESDRHLYTNMFDPDIYARHLRSVRVVALTNATCAVFDYESVMELMDDPEFGRAYSANLYQIVQKVAAFNTLVYQSDAYSAVRFAMQFAKAQHAKNLTHAQIAYLTGLGRSTVTQAMHELTVAEPELFSE